MFDLLKHNIFSDTANSAIVSKTMMHFTQSLALCLKADVETTVP